MEASSPLQEEYRRIMTFLIIAPYKYSLTYRENVPTTQHFSSITVKLTFKNLKKTFWSPLSADFPKIPIPKQDNVHRMPAICLDPVPQILNPLERRGNYSATSTNMKLVHWPLMGGLLHLVQRWGDCAGPQPVEAPPRCTKCNSAPNNYQCTNHVTV